MCANLNEHIVYVYYLIAVIIIKKGLDQKKNPEEFKLIVVHIFKWPINLLIEMMSECTFFQQLNGNIC